MQQLFVAMLLLVSIGQVKAQNSDLKIVSANGGSAQLESIQLDWTVGELSITGIQNSSTLITQGFHQSNFKLTAIDDLEAAVGEIKVYPNPTTDFLEMKLEFDRGRSISIRMIDAVGRMVWSDEVSGQLIARSISMKQFPAGNYFLHFLVDGNAYHQTLKIQKLK